MSISRRSFLKGAAAASLAVAASGVLAGCSGITGGLTGGAYVSGTKSGSFKVADGKTIDVSISNVEWVEYYNQLIPTLKVVNKADSAVNVATTASAGTAYSIVAEVNYIGVAGSQKFSINKIDTALTGIEIDKDATGTLVIDTDADTEWTAVQLTLTIHDGTGAKISGVDPVVFTIKK